MDQELGESQGRPSKRIEFLGLALLSVAAPLVAAMIHSECVFHRGTQLYNAKIGGAYFFHVENPGGETVYSLIRICVVSGILTFFALLPFRGNTLLRWLVWTTCIAIWTW